MKLREKINRYRAELVDGASFGLINALHLRHSLPKQFLSQWMQYADFWKDRSIEEYYALPENLDSIQWPNSSQSSVLHFPSPIITAFPENNISRFDLYPCKLGWTAPTMIITHGLMSVSDRGYQQWAKKLNALGWNALFMHLPFHYSRRVPRYLQGELAIGADFLRTAESLRQAVIEMRIVLHLLARKGGHLFGAWGTSYGGWITALAACVEPLLQRLILVEPILNIETAIWNSPASRSIRATLKRHGVTPLHTESHLRFCCPSRQQPKLDGKNILLLAGKYDRISTPEQVEELHHLWNGSHFHCFKQGHVGYTLMPESFRSAQELWPKDFKKIPQT